MSKRILGHLRIFQSVHNDLNLMHQPEKHSYMYPSVDPYELEDGAFPGTVAAIQSLITAAEQRGYERGAREELERLEALAIWGDLKNLEGPTPGVVYRGLQNEDLKARARIIFAFHISDRLAQLNEQEEA